MAQQLQLRRDSAANWTSANPILAQGELGLDLTNIQLRMGDGVNHWLDLTPFTIHNHPNLAVLNTIVSIGTAAQKDTPPSGDANSGQVVLGSDSRLTNNRNPTVHASSHGQGQADAISISESQVINLNSDLAAKVASNAPILGATNTKITYDSKGLVTAGSSLSATDIPFLDASKINSGVFNISQIPASALERLVQVPDQAARFALTTTIVQNGDTVKQLDTGVMYVVVDDTNLGNSSGYTSYSAGSAASVPWSGVTGTPTTLSGYGITDGVNSSDPRLTNSRNPTSHAASHASAGSDPITISESQVTNLTTDLANKVAANVAIPGGTNTKITYDSKGLVTSGASATTADIADSLNKRYITDADLSVLGNTSGTNSGNETATSIGSLINGASAKATPVDTDQLGLMDSAASNVLKKLSWANVKVTLKTYLDTLYAATFNILPISRGGTNSQTALNNNRVIQSLSGAIVEAPAITPSRALESDANGIPIASATLATELAFVSGVTASIQTQLNNMAFKTSVSKISTPIIAVAVPAGQNYVTLASTTKPGGNIASTAPNLGTLCSKLAGAIGSNALTTDNIYSNVCEIFLSSTNEAIFTNGARIYGLLQVGSTATDGSIFSDSGANQAQLSFVYWNPNAETFVACPVADIQGKTIEYLYNKRSTEIAKDETSFYNFFFSEINTFGLNYQSAQNTNIS